MPIDVHTVDDLAAAIMDRRTRHFVEDQERYHQKNPIASQLPGRGAGCWREVFYSCRHWKEKPLWDIERLARFSAGNREEEDAKRALHELGFELIHGQRAFAIESNGKTVITGKMDGQIEMGKKRAERRRPPIEIKNYHPNLFQRIDTIEDFFRSPWTAKAPRQLLAGMYAVDEPEGLFLLTSLGHWKLIPIVLADHRDEIADVIDQAHVVVGHIEKNEAPPYTTNPAECRRCWAFGTLCKPPLSFGEGIQVCDDGEVEEEIKRYLEIVDMKKEAEAIWKRLRARFAQSTAEKILAGDFMLSFSERRSSRYDIPDDVKAKYKTPTTQRIMKVEPVPEGTKGGD